MKGRYFFIFVVLLSFLLLSACDEKSKKKFQTCDPADAGACGENQVCAGIGNGKFGCLDVCDPALADACKDDLACLPARGTFACAPTCDPADAGACGDGWACAPYGETGMCLQVCDPQADDCASPDAVCVPWENGTAVCVDACDRENPDTCPGGRVCELRTDALSGCYLPVFFDGSVTDSSNGEPIEAARVLAADATGAVATTVAITDAQGAYSLRVPVTRNPDGTLAEGVFTLRASAADYQQFPAGIRPSLPVDATQAVLSADGWRLSSALTDITLIPLEPGETRFSVSGRVVVTSGAVGPRGVLLVLENAANAGEAPFGFADATGEFVLFNVPVGNYSLHGYKANLQLNAVDVNVAAADVTGVEVTQSDVPLATVSGSVQIVNAPGGSMTTVVLVPESTFSETFVKGEVPPGLRAPAPPGAPSITGEFSIAGVPSGRYVVLAAFENDGLVRDPDPSIGGTQIVHIEVDGSVSTTVELPASFKITEALEILYPGATEPEAVDPANLEFRWVDDSSEDSYRLVVYNAFGELVWERADIPKVTGGNAQVPYEGPALEQGMYYQFRVWSMRTSGPISSTEDLLGVFYVPAQLQ